MTLNALEITSDLSHLYLNEKLHRPKIFDGDVFHEGFDIHVIPLRAQLHDELDWKYSLSQAEELKAKGSLILWDIDLGLTQDKIVTTDSSNFAIHSQALSYFSEKVFPLFASCSYGVILFRGNGFFEERIVWTEQHKETFEEWLLEKKMASFASIDPHHYQRLFSTDAFSEYLHRLMAALPAELAIFCLFDPIEKNFAKMAQLFSKERFEYIHLGFKNLPFIFPSLAWDGGVSTFGTIGTSSATTSSPAPLAVVLPLDEFCSPKVLETLNRLIEKLLESTTPFRIVSEFFLAQGWDLVSTLLVDSSAISPQGKRKLLGFVAAGGALSYVGDPLDFVEEDAQAAFLLN